MSSVPAIRAGIAVRPPPPAELVVSARQLEEHGVAVRALFAGQRAAFRRVERVAHGLVELDGAGTTAVWVPQALLPRAEPGQWLRFSLRVDRKVAVAVDLDATLRGESKLAGLLTELTNPRIRLR